MFYTKRYLHAKNVGDGVFGRSADQLSFRDAARAFARAELADGYLDRASGTTFPWEVHRKVGELGMLGMLAGPGYSPTGTDDYLAAGLQ